MNEADVPYKFPTLFATSASSGDITTPIPVTTGTPGRCSFDIGFPDANFQPEGSGGIPPFGQDFNGLMQAFCAWLQWMQAGGPVQYDSAFQTGIGGYPKGAIITSAATAGLLWLCTVDANTTDPDTGGAGWENISPDRAAGGALTGFYPNPSLAAGAGKDAGEVWFWPGTYWADSSTPITSACPWTKPAFVCNGQLISRSANPKLLAAAAPLGTVLAPFTAGDGSTTFGVPNYQGLFLRGYDPTGLIDPGHALGTKELDAYQGHYHGPLSPALNFRGRETSPPGPQGISSGSGGVEVLTTGASVTDTTNGTPRIAAETRPVNSNGYWLIKGG